MRATKTVALRNRARNPSLDEWSTISPDADACSDEEDRIERGRRAKIYAKQVAKNVPIEFIKE
jgi:hypothetical protein